ncbi:MAG: polar amino acid transport system substrate-binding protein [Nocardioidaceae bacterium]|nr:polar amino acid transport system substrate-binding protein [Nocardioidaceae bacterium]
MPAHVPLSRPAVLLGASLLCIASVACAPKNSTNPNASGGSTASPCAHPKTVKPGVLTIATDDPAFSPWMINNKPTNGKGFESAVAYAVAQKMGFPKGKVTWTREPFNASYQPGPKNFDFDINQISISAKRAQAVTFSEGYYTVEQAIITLKDSPYADATSLSDFKNATLGAQVGTTSLDAILDTIKTSKQPQVFDDTNLAKTALLNHQVDGIVTDLPTAFEISAVQIPGSTIVGKFQSTTGTPEQFGLLFQKGDPLVRCADQALTALKSNGTLARIQNRWLSRTSNSPTLTP